MSWLHNWIMPLFSMGLLDKGVSSRKATLFHAIGWWHRRECAHAVCKTPPPFPKHHDWFYRMSALILLTACDKCFSMILPIVSHMASPWRAFSSSPSTSCQVTNKRETGTSMDRASFSSKSAETKFTPLSIELRCFTDMFTFSDNCSWDSFFAFR